MNDKYVLCFRGENKEGKEEILKIYEASLSNIDKYTCYKGCYSSNDLYRLLPPEIKNYILTFKHNYDFEGNFFIRKACKDISRGRTDLSILFKSDADVVYTKETDIYTSLLGMKKNNDDKEEIKTIKNNFFKELYEILLERESSLTEKIDAKIEASGTTESRINAVSKMPSCLKEISKYVTNKYELKRRFAILLKFYKKQVDDIYGVKTRIVNEKVLDERAKERNFSYAKAEANMLKNLNDKLFKIKEENKAEEKSETKTQYAKYQTKKSKNKLEDNPDYINYMTFIEERNKKDVQDDFEDDELDDFLGPVKPNDPRYWSIN